jgi:hypothetical protein
MINRSPSALEELRLRPTAPLGCMHAWLIREDGDAFEQSEFEGLEVHEP